MKKGLLKKAALVAAIGTALMGILETVMASELENDNSWIIEECGPEGMLKVMEWLSIDEIAQNANSQGIDNAIQGYDSVMNDDGETKYIIYDYVFENGSISCSYMSETLPVENRYGLSDTIQKHFTPVEEYDLSEYRDYNVYRSNDGTYYLVGPIFLGDAYQNYYIPWTYEDMDNMIVSLADFYR